uniref:Uncharacterized protein n=1 Tax=Canis lupus dingo TaxID=286419 RepID=A0A8C0K6T6_CANLU
METVASSGSSSAPENEHLQETPESNSSVYPFFRRFHCCCGLIPTSSKSVVLDMSLQVEEASFASVTSGGWFLFY